MVCTQTYGFVKNLKKTVAERFGVPLGLDVPLAGPDWARGQRRLQLFAGGIYQRLARGKSRGRLLTRIHDCQPRVGGKENVDDAAGGDAQKSPDNEKEEQPTAKKGNLLLLGLSDAQGSSSQAAVHVHGQSRSAGATAGRDYGTCAHGHSAERRSEDPFQKARIWY